MEIKFRGKRKDNGEWIYGDLVQAPSGRRYIQPLDPSLPHIDINQQQMVDPETVGQFTGEVADKEIYHHDFVQIFARIDERKNFDNEALFVDRTGIFEVVWSKEYPMWTLRYVSGDLKEWSFYDKGDTATWKVIGNIHEENPNAK